MTNEKFENEIVDYWKSTELSKSIPLGKFKSIARYFYGLGLNENTMNKEIIDKYVNNDHLVLEGSSEKPNNHEERVPEIKETGTRGLDEAARLWIAGVFLAYSVPDTSVKELREIAEKSFIAGAKWAMEQGETYKVKVIKDGIDGFKTIQHTVESFEPEEEVIIQIRKRR